MHDESGESVGTVIVILLAYVDDLIMASSTEAAESMVVDAIARVVPTKVTGTILPSQEGGGKVTFIGRDSFRHALEPAVHIMVKPVSTSTFKEYGIDKGSSSVPDISAHLEKTTKDQAAQQLSTSSSSVSFNGYASFSSFAV